MATNLQTVLGYMVIPVGMYALVSVGLSWITTKSIKSRRMLLGASIVLVQNGEILLKGLRQARYDLNDLLAECRSAGRFNLNDLALVLTKHTEKTSFSSKEDCRPIIPQDLNLQPPKRRIGCQSDH